MAYTKDQIKALLQTNDRAVVRGILAIYANQTYDEQQAEATKVDNGIGFNGADAAIMSSFAKQVHRGYRLTEKQMAIARKRIVKYAKQLMNIANAREQAKTA